MVTTVHDDGPGIAQDIRGKVFDPFFTTKDPGEGTGLGLSICHGIVTQHGGTMSMENPAEGGVTFRIELPVSFDPSGPKP